MIGKPPTRELPQLLDEGLGRVCGLVGKEVFSVRRTNSSSGNIPNTILLKLVGAVGTSGHRTRVSQTFKVLGAHKERRIYRLSQSCGPQFLRANFSYGVSIRRRWPARREAREVPTGPAHRRPTLPTWVQSPKRIECESAHGRARRMHLSKTGDGGCGRFCPIRARGMEIRILAGLACLPARTLRCSKYQLSSATCSKDTQSSNFRTQR
jgi:hypothetical protein